MADAEAIPTAVTLTTRDGRLIRLSRTDRDSVLVEVEGQPPHVLCATELDRVRAAVSAPSNSPGEPAAVQRLATCA